MMTNVSIPLTFDWLTLTWLKTRMHVWWRSGRASPRQLALLLMLGLFAGCVPATQFEETQSAAQVEMEGRRRSEYQVSQLKAENTELRARMQKQTQVLDDRDQALSQAELDSLTLGKQREDAAGMVEQLRGELARVGGHLQTFHDDQQKLQSALAAAAARGRALSRLSRDASLSMAEPIATGEYTLDAEQSSVVLRVPREKLLTDDGSVKPEAEPVLANVVRLMQLHKQAKLRVEDSAHEGDAIAVSRLVAALTERAVAAERFEPLAAKPEAALEPAAAGAQNPGPAEVSFAFSVP
jgi:hypothetical protein